MKQFLLVCVLSACTLNGQDPGNTGDDLVTVKRKYVSKDGIQSTQIQQKLDSVSAYAGIGKEIGIATKEALDGVVDVSDKFSKTDIGHFVLFMVAFKILGQKALAVVLGVPIFLLGIGVWLWVFRRVMLPYQVMTEYDATTKVKKYATEQFEFNDTDYRPAAAVVFVCAIVAWCISWIVVIFG